MSEQITRFQVESVVIKRSEILNAPYNPRKKLKDSVAKQLKNNIKNRGLMGGIVVNKRTMHLVSGHQRLEQLDSLEKGTDYLIRVDIVDLTDKEEKEQNIFMNNRNVQGEFDETLLAGMIGEIDYKAAGLDDYDLNMLGVVEIITEPEAEDVISDIQDLQKPIEDKKAHVKEVKKQVAEQAKSKVDEGESYFMMSFDNYEAKKAFMVRFGFDPADKFIKGEVFSEMVERVE